MYKTSEAILALLWCINTSSNEVWEVKTLVMICKISLRWRHSSSPNRYSYLLADNLVWNSKFYGGHFEYIYLAYLGMVKVERFGKL